MRGDEDLFLATSSLRARFSRANAGLLSLESLQTGWTVAQGPGVAFRLGIPLPGQERNAALSSEQEPPTWKIAHDRIAATWERVSSQHGGVHDIAVTLTVEARDEFLLLGMTITNSTPDLWVDEVRCPCLVGVQPPSAEAPLDLFQPFYGSALRHGISPSFENVPGYWGVSNPTIVTVGPGHVTSPGLPYVLLESTDQGLYLGLGGRSDSPLGWLAELHPGWADSMLKDVPRRDLDAPESTSVHVVGGHLPYVGPGERRALTSVALAAYHGDWHAGVDLYRRISKTWQRPPAPVPGWAARLDAWQQVQLNSLDSFTYRFDDLPGIARQCAQRGVRTIQVVGWNTGGQDIGNPVHTPDPRLGGAAGLAAAIAECQEVGVRVVLFTKFTWADKAQRDYWGRFHRWAIRNPYGDEYPYAGYAYWNLSQLWDVSAHQLVPMCFGAEEYIEFCADQFAAVVASGADGMLYDECQHHMPALVCFADDHGHRRGFPVYSRDNDLVRRFRAAPGVGTEFLMAGEAIYDDELEEYALSYFRTDDLSHLPVARYTRPDSMLVTAVVGFDDRIMVNQCLLYRYVISYEPYFFKGTLADIPLTVAYGTAMDVLRSNLREWFWDGEFRDTVGLSVTDEADPQHLRAALYVSRSDGSPGVVVSNESGTDVTRVSVAIDGYSGPFAWRIIDGDGWSDDRCITVPPRSAAVVLPLDRLPLPSSATE